jgi:hypothetical protein
MATMVSSRFMTTECHNLFVIGRFKQLRMVSEKAIFHQLSVSNQFFARIYWLGLEIL